MADNFATMNYDPSTRTASLTGGGCTLNYGDTLKISIGTGFPAGATMQLVTLGFFNAVDGKKGSTHEGDWFRAGNSLIPDGVSVVGNADGSVTITDSDTGTNDEDYYYQCTAKDTTTGTPYDADPELIVRKRPGPTQSQRRPSISPEV